jgi:uncharacterized protein (DUF1810 family)
MTLRQSGLCVERPGEAEAPACIVRQGRAVARSSGASIDEPQRLCGDPRHFVYPLAARYRGSVSDTFQLQRFVDAQDHGGTYEAAVAELRAGRKRGHWMWFVFPQIAGLGHSPISRRFAISSLDEARAYLAHPILRPRLTESAAIVSGLRGRSAEEIFGETDAAKLRSSMTLFAHADPTNSVFQQVLDAYFAGEADAATDRLLQASAGRSPPRRLPT